MEILRCNNLDELLESLSKETGDYGILAGGTDIYPKVNQGRFNVGRLYSIENLKGELGFIKLNDSSIEIGALATLTEIIGNEEVTSKIPQLVSALKSIGSVQIRNVATLTGNIVNASPIADSAPVLLSKRAIIHVVSKIGRRSVEIDKFFLKYKCVDLKPGELVYSIEVPINGPTDKFEFKKIATRPNMALSKINFAYLLSDGQLFLAAGGIDEVPKRLYGCEKAMLTKNLTKKILDKTLDSEIAPISDVHSSAEYRKAVLLKILFDLYSAEL